MQMHIYMFKTMHHIRGVFKFRIGETRGKINYQVRQKVIQCMIYSTLEDRCTNQDGLDIMGLPDSATVIQ